MEGSQVISLRTLPEGRRPRVSFVRGAERPVCTDPLRASHGCCLSEGDVYARHHMGGVGEYPELIGPGW